MSKAFDKVWHDALIFKLKSIGVHSNFLKLICNYLQNRKQRVVLNGVTSAWKGICAGVPPMICNRTFIIFDIYINDLPNRIVSNTKLFADDVSIFSSVSKDEESRIALGSDLKIISDWKMRFNPDPNKTGKRGCIFTEKS